MEALEVANQSDFSQSALEAAISLYAFTWGEIIRTELHIDSDSGLRELLHMQQLTRKVVFPEGQRAVIDKTTGLPVGTINSLLYNSHEFPMVESWNQLTGDGYHMTHDPKGDSLICVAIQTSKRGAARQLVEVQADLAKRLGKNLFVFTRPNGYAAYLQGHPGVTIEQYLELVVKGRLEIPGDGVSFHNHIGAVLAPLLKGSKPYLHNSRPGDASSLSYNVLMQYPLL